MKRGFSLGVKLGICAGALLMVAAAVWYYLDEKTFRDAQDAYDEIVLLTAAQAGAAGAPLAAEEEYAPPARGEAGGLPTEESAPLAAGEVGSLPDGLAPTMPEATEGDYQSRIDFAALAQVNADVVGWIRAEGTNIDYPIVQGTNNEYYLDHLFTKKTSSAGCIFLDVANGADFSDKNSIIYGHHLRSQRMFAPITFYRKKGYYEQHPTMQLFTPSRDYEVQLFAGAVVNPRQRNTPYYHMSFADDESFLKFIKAIRERSDFDAEVEVEVGDRILTLSTCSYEYQDARYVLLGKLIPLPSYEGESLP